ncbi:MAG: hypothetical protein ABTQ25_17970 [Nitrosomonas ureae]
MNKPIENEQSSTETTPKRPRRKYRSKKLGASGLSACMAKRCSIRTSWEGLFFDIKGRL